ncbi:MAG: TPR repeat-containing [Planctomycetota bacterium]|nr:MAG: TPR repeat-containing [Planctomycetota bacterium]
MYLNAQPRTGRFIDVAYALGLDFDDDGRSAIPVDIDGDGDLDLALLSLQKLSLVLNTSPPAHFSRLRLKARNSEPLALGAVVTLVAGNSTQRDYVRIVDGFMSQVPADLHFGLGHRDRIDRIDVSWPSGQVQSWLSPPVDCLLILQEDATAAEASPLPRWPAGSVLGASPVKALQTPAAPLLAGPATLLAEPGRATVVNFWDPESEASMAEIPGLLRIRAEFGADVRFDGVCREQKDLEPVCAAVKAHSMTYPQFVADAVLLKAFFGPGGAAPVPATFVFDPAGRLRRYYSRPVNEEELRALLASFGAEAVSVSDLDGQAAQQVLVQNYESALELYARAEEIAPGSASRWLNRGFALLELGKLEEARAAFQRSVSLDPLDAQAVSNLGTVLTRMGSPEQGIDCYRKALELGGEDARTLLNLGNAAAMAKRLPDALSAFERACAAEPGEARAWAGRGKVLMVMGRIDESIQALRRAVEIGGDVEEAKGFLMKLEAEKKRKSPR